MTTEHPSTLPDSVYEIDSEPHMEPEGKAVLEEHLTSHHVFLEYGSGGSSVLAIRKGVKRIYSVDSDRRFLDAVEARVIEEGAGPSTYIPVYVDIGPTKAWGRPVDDSHAKSWPHYSSAPWSAARERGDQPTLILIDGRFRVATFLISALLASPGCVILFDDYFTRPAYHVVERYFKPSRQAGRMAEFVINTFERPDLALIDLMNYVNESE